MTQPMPEKGIFGIDLLPGIDIQDLLPKPVQEAIKGTVDRILEPAGDLEIGSPQPSDRPIPVDAGSQELSDAVKAIDAITKALATVLKYGGILIPDEYEKMIAKVVGALNTVRSWLD